MQNVCITKLDELAYTKMYV